MIKTFKEFWEKELIGREKTSFDSFFRNRVEEIAANAFLAGLKAGEEAADVKRIQSIRIDSFG